MSICIRPITLYAVVIMALFSAAFAGTTSQKPAGASLDKALLGAWYDEKGTAVFNENGTMIYNGQNYYFSTANNVITLVGTGGVLYVPYQVSGGKLSVIVNNEKGVMTRNRPAVKAAGSSAGGGNIDGKWCYLSSFNATGGGGSMSNRCFTLYKNGTYEYYGESSSGGQYGSAASQGSDRGTWSANGSALITESSRYGRHTYRLERRNHPKNKDPMLVIDGDAYVTYYNRPPW